MSIFQNSEFGCPVARITYTVLVETLNQA